MHATEIERSPGHAVVDRDHAAAVHAPGHVVLLLARGHAAVALDAALGVAEKFHSGHGCLLVVSVRVSELRDLAQRRLGFLHHRHRVVAVGRRGVDRLAAHDRVRALRVVLEHVLALPPAGEMERDERRARADALGHQRLDLDLRAGRRLHPDVLAVADAAVVGVLRIDLDEVLLLQLGEPRIGARFLAAALVLDQAAATSGSAGTSSRPPWRRSPAARSCTASAAARTPSCRRASDTSRPCRAAASTAARGAAGCASGKFQTTARALALPNGWQPWFFIEHADMPPERSVFQFLPSAAFFSSSVSSSHQPSFFSSTWSNSG